MRRIAIAIGLSGLLAACGQQTQTSGEGAAVSAQLDYIDAMPIDEPAPAPVAQPEPAAKKEERAEEAKAADAAEVPAEPEVSPAPAPARTATPVPVPVPANDAAAATRRANESTATPYETTPRPN